MKKTIRVTTVILIIILICMGYSGNYIVAEKPDIHSTGNDKHEADTYENSGTKKNNRVDSPNCVGQANLLQKADTAQGILDEGTALEESESVLKSTGDTNLKSQELLKDNEDDSLEKSQDRLKDNGDTKLKDSQDKSFENNSNGRENKTSTTDNGTISITGLKREIDANKPMVALTFDDGPHPKYTTEILKALKENDAVATFFVVGNRAEKYKSTIQDIIEGGNEIGNHTYDHKDLTKLSRKEIENEISKTAKILESITGKTPLITRPTYGSINKNVRLYTDSPLVLWSVDTQDWKSRDKKKIINKALNSVKDGDIILMHDIYKSTADAAKVIIKELKAKGYQMVTISELYQARNVTLQNGQAYYKCTPNSGKNSK